MSSPVACEPCCPHDDDFESCHDWCSEPAIDTAVTHVCDRCICRACTFCQSPPPSPMLFETAVTCEPSTPHDASVESCYTWCSNLPEANCGRCKCLACAFCRPPPAPPPAVPTLLPIAPPPQQPPPPMGPPLLPPPPMGPPLPPLLPHVPTGPTLAAPPQQPLRLPPLPPPCSPPLVPPLPPPLLPPLPLAPLEGRVGPSLPPVLDAAIPLTGKLSSPSGATFIVIGVSLLLLCALLALVPRFCVRLARSSPSRIVLTKMGHIGWVAGHMGRVAAPVMRHVSVDGVSTALSCVATGEAGRGDRAGGIAAPEGCAVDADEVADGDSDNERAAPLCLRDSVSCPPTHPHSRLDTDADVEADNVDEPAQAESSTWTLSGQRRARVGQGFPTYCSQGVVGLCSPVPSEGERPNSRGKWASAVAFCGARAPHHS